MPLVTTKEMFEKAYKGGYAIGAFNVNNMEIIQGITEAAKEEKSPVILQVSAGARKYAKHVYLLKLVEAAVADTDIPMALHLDHGESFEICKDCIDGGFTSVMIDGSKYSFEENIEITRKVVEYAHARGVVVEGELGKLAGIEDAVNVSEADAQFTNPAEVEEFVTRTGVDSLAIAIGTSHGAFKFKPGQKPQLRFDILEQIQQRLPDVEIVVSSILPAKDPAFERSSKWRNIPEWSKALEKACQENGILFANCDSLYDDYPNLWDPDGIHFRKEFYPYWASCLLVAQLMEG